MKTINIQWPGQLERSGCMWSMGWVENTPIMLGAQENHNAARSYCTSAPANNSKFAYTDIACLGPSGTPGLVKLSITSTGFSNREFRRFLGPCTLRRDGALIEREDRMPRGVGGGSGAKMNGWWILDHCCSRSLRRVQDRL